jgi:dihydroorotate dehydrogenase electron transfer subunit
MIDRSLICEEAGEVVAVERWDSIVEVTVRLPRLAAHVQPGQFAQLQLADADGPLLRRPFSIAWVEADCCSFVLTPVGRGTRALAALQIGDRVNSLGPLGHGFDVSSPDRAVIVSGGVGCAPFPFVIEALRRTDATVTVLSGAATASRLYPAERFGRGDSAVRVIEATDDGSAGAHGRVIDLLDQELVAGSTIYACGPNRMVAALAQRLKSFVQPPTRTLASLEAPMGCGFGTCLGCALPLRGADDQWALCCSDGPVFAIEAIDWDELLKLPGAEVA